MAASITPGRRTDRGISDILNCGLQSAGRMIAPAAGSTQSHNLRSENKSTIVALARARSGCHCLNDNAPWSTAMTQTNSRFLDEIARLMNDAAGVAQGVRREFDTLFRTQAERILRDLDVIKREEFEAVKEMATLAREENEALKARLDALEAKLGKASKAAKSDAG
jgi:BMFP domain-containing protein YqiC